MTDLTELILEDNQLSILPESIGNLTNLTKLSLYGNQLSTLPESIGNLTNLTELNLQGNKLSTLPESIGDLTNLKELYLSTNQLSTLPESIGDLTNLKELYLFNNQIQIDKISSSVVKALRYYECNAEDFRVDFKIPPLKTTLVWYETYTTTREFSTELTEEEAELFETDRKRFFSEVKYTYNQNLEFEKVVDNRTHDFELT